MVDSSTQVPEHDCVKEEREDPKATKKDPKPLENDHYMDASPTVQDPNIKEEVVVKEDVPAIVPDGASSTDVERGVKKPTEVSDQAEVLSPILSSRGPRVRAAPAASSYHERLFHDLDTRVAAPTLLHKLLPDPDLSLNSLLKFEGTLQEVHDANYDGVSTTGDYAGKVLKSNSHHVYKNLVF